MLVGSGWQGIELTPLDFQIPLGRTMEDALAFVLEMGPLSAPLGEVTGENRTRAIDAINRVLEDNTCDDGIVRLSRRLLDRYGAGGLKPSVSNTTSPTNRARVSRVSASGMLLSSVSLTTIRSIATSRARSASRAVSAWLRLPR